MSPSAVQRMRTCSRVAAVWEGWTADEQAEISAAIRAALDAGDSEILACWAAWLEDMSGLARMTALCRAAEARIKAERKAA